MATELLSKWHPAKADLQNTGELCIVFRQTQC